MLVQLSTDKSVYNVFVLKIKNNNQKNRKIIEGKARKTSQSETKWTNIRILSVINQHDRVPVAWVTCCLADRRLDCLAEVFDVARKKQTTNAQQANKTLCNCVFMCVSVCVCTYWPLAHGCASIAWILSSLLWYKMNARLLLKSFVSNKMSEQARKRKARTRMYQPRALLYLIITIISVFLVLSVKN